MVNCLICSLAALSRCCCTSNHGFKLSSDLNYSDALRHSFRINRICIHSVIFMWKPKTSFSYIEMEKPWSADIWNIKCNLKGKKTKLKFKTIEMATHDAHTVHYRKQLKQNTKIVKHFLIIEVALCSAIRKLIDSNVAIKRICTWTIIDIADNETELKIEN